MLSSWTTLPLPLFWHAILQSIRDAGLIDFFDIASVTILLYLAFLWIRRSKAMRVLQGILLLGLFYAVASQAGLTLTTSVFRGLFTVIMVSLVSLFQEDLRHFFERMTVYQSSPLHRPTFQAILRSTRRFSKAHTGALIIVQGHDPLDRHLNGGQLLGGSVSSALLESLFEPHSAGHDGAAIIEGDRLTRFGVHLPLSKNIAHESGMGTRHAAALGLSEVCDAFCLVVSEQRGTISAAYQGRLQVLPNWALLERRLGEYLRKTFQTGSSLSRWRTTWDHSVEKTCCLVLGLLLWLVFVKGIKPAQADISVPVVAGRVPAGFQVDKMSPARALVTVRGLEADLRRLSAEKIQISLNTFHPSTRMQEIILSPKSAVTSASYQVVSVMPGAVMLSLRRTEISRRLVKAPPRHVWFKI